MSSARRPIRVVGAARRIHDDLGLGEPDADAVTVDSA